MNKIMNIYCDESCHLENDQNKVMVLGAVSCPYDEKERIFKRIREIKIKHNISLVNEIKWVKVGKAKLQVYLDLVELFFKEDCLSFRAVVVPNKSILNYEKHNLKSHDEFYYRIYFRMLEGIVYPKQSNNIYLDIKESYGGTKVDKHEKVLRNRYYDSKKTIIKTIQIIRSHEVELMQLVDILIGALGYINRNLKSSPYKLELVKKIQKKTGYSLNKTTFIKENKFNILIWQSKEDIG